MVIGVSAEIDYSIKINDGAARTRDRQVDLDMRAPRGTHHMRIANDQADLADADWQPFREDKNWTLPGRTGTQTVFVQFRDRDGGVSRVYRDSITLELEETPKVVINDGENETRVRRVELYIVAPENARRMRISDTPDLTEVKWRRVTREVHWTLPKENGRRYIYVQFEYRDGRISNIYTDSILLHEPVEPVAQFTINGDVGVTDRREVKLSFRGVRVYDQLRISNTRDFAHAEWVPFTKLTVPWVIAGEKGLNNVYVEFGTVDGEHPNKVVRESIRYTPPSVDATGGGLVRGPAGGFYYLGVDNALHPFSHPAVLFSYYSDLSGARVLSDAEIKTHIIGQPVCVRAGTWLVKFRGFARVYAVEPGCVLRPIRSEVEAYVLFGPTWPHRVVTFDARDSRVYTLTTHAAADRLQDTDGDGLTATQEREAGSSDTETDSDGDALSDYEEVMYWKTNPAAVDSDGDGIPDGLEILQGRLPTGAGLIEAIPAATYQYPHGTLLYHWWKNKRYYYLSDGETFYSVARRTPEQRFVSNRFQEQFVVRPPHPLSFETSNRFIAPNDSQIRDPLKTISGTALPL